MNNVLVEREIDDETVSLTIENNSDRSADVEITDIVAGSEPALANGDASVVEMDGEWFVKWSTTVSAGDEATLEYEVDGDADFEVSVDGLENEKLTIDA
jgi:DNA topoisomerase-6 subunit B